MDWIKEIANARDLLDEDYQQIVDSIGMDNLIKLIQLSNKQSVYISLSKFDRVRRAYILSRKNIDVKELAKKLEVSERYVYKVLEDGDYTPANQLKMDV